MFPLVPECSLGEVKQFALQARVAKRLLIERDLRVLELQYELQDALVLLLRANGPSVLGSKQSLGKCSGTNRRDAHGYHGAP